MKRNVFLALAAIVLIGSLSMIARHAAAARSCSTCPGTYDACMTAGNTSAYCEQNQPASCYGCAESLDNTTQKTQKPDSAIKRSARLGLISKEFLPSGQVA